MIYPFLERVIHRNYEFLWKKFIEESNSYQEKEGNSYQETPKSEDMKKQKCPMVEVLVTQSIR